MKLFFKLFIIVAIFSSTSLATEYNIEYNIKVRGLEIGSLLWHLELDLDKYTTTIQLNDSGIFSGLYKFRGEYKARGKIKNASLFPQEYSQIWKTKRKKREVNIFFEKNKITKLILHPEEKEEARINYFKLLNYMDPLSSFLNILINNSPSKTIDGRRTYTLNPSNDLNGLIIKEMIWSILKYIQTKKFPYFPPRLKLNLKIFFLSLQKINIFVFSNTQKTHRQHHILCLPALHLK